MIQPQTLLKIADNSGARVGRVFKILGGTRKRYAHIGDIVVAAVLDAEPRKQVKKKDVVHVVVVRQKRPYRRKDGSYIAFDENAGVIVEKGKKEPIAGRIFGPIPHEIGELGFQKIIGLAPEVV